MKTTKDQLAALLQQKVPQFDALKPLNQQLNSLEIFTVLSDVEREFAVNFHSVELTNENLATVDAWAALIDRKRK